MYGTGIDGYLGRQRNEELLREMRALRLEGRLRSNRQHRSKPRRGFRLPVRIHTLFLRHAQAE